jgi:predicted phage terminase large subunit-like protein
MHMLRLLHGSAVTVLPVTGAKDVRAEPFASQVAGGNVYMVTASWNRELLDEMRTFPLGKNDDIVDALTDAYDELVGRGGGWGAV